MIVAVSLLVALPVLVVGSQCTAKTWLCYPDAPEVQLRSPDTFVAEFTTSKGVFRIRATRAWVSRGWRLLSLQDCVAPAPQHIQPRCACRPRGSLVLGSDRVCDRFCDRVCDRVLTAAVTCTPPPPPRHRMVPTGSTI